MIITDVFNIFSWVKVKINLLKSNFKLCLIYIKDIKCYFLPVLKYSEGNFYLFKIKLVVSGLGNTFIIQDKVSIETNLY